MNRTSLLILVAMLSPHLFADNGQRLIPAGSLISCTTAEPRISSKTTAIGDPVLCQVGHAEKYGRSVLPLDAYLVGRFEDYKDPGHFVGKGWMELKFDRMVIEPNTVVPIDARVVDVPGYKVDNQGRILGKGHVARDITMWSIPVLWPIDLLMLPARGPRPVLKEEARLTLKVMDDLSVPSYDGPQRDPYGLIPRQQNGYDQAPPPLAQDQQQPPELSYGPGGDAPAPYDSPAPAPPAMAYGPAPMPYAPVAMAPPPPIYGGVMIAPRPYGVVYGPRPFYGYGYGPRVVVGARFGGYAYGGRVVVRGGYGFRR
jgi:hypothetical protein